MSTKRTFVSWVLLLLGAYGAMVFAGGFVIATSCMLVISAAFGLFHALGEALSRDGYEIPESRRHRTTTPSDVANREMTTLPNIDHLVVNRAS